MSGDTIFALSSGNVPSGVAIIRLSGPKVRFAFETMIGFLPSARKAVLAKINDGSGQLLDQAIVLFFEGPQSFTGEDCGEFHVHGSRAVLNAVLNELGQFDGFRLAEAGEFSRRAFENGRLDLTEIEGLSDLISANTEHQRVLAQKQTSGMLRILYDDWRNRLIKLRAHIEADLDFSEEEDIPDDVNHHLIDGVEVLMNDITAHLDTFTKGEIIREGFKVSLVGAPNSGKSSLLNALAKRDVAIVSEYKGTTRDIINISLNLDGFEVVISDTAGIRDTDDVVERIGIDRAIDSGRDANLTLFLQSSDQDPWNQSDIDEMFGDNVEIIYSKSDLLSNISARNDGIYVSAITQAGLKDLEQLISICARNSIGNGDQLFLTRLRHKLLLEKSLSHLNSIVIDNEMMIELISEELRLASDQLGRIIGKVDVEDLLDAVFSEFCVGK